MIISSGAYSVTVKDPELGNTETLDLRTQFIRTMSSAIYAFRATPVPVTNQFVFNDLTKQQVTDLAELLDKCVEEDISFASTPITVTGKVTNQPVFTSTKRGLKTITLEVQT